MDAIIGRHRQTDALQVAREEIERLKRTVSELRNAMAEQGTAAVANQEEIKRLKKDRASLSTQRALALLETETMADRMHAMQATRIGACADRQPEH